jgi:hypothetical protein
MMLRSLASFYQVLAGVSAVTLAGVLLEAGQSEETDTPRADAESTADAEDAMIDPLSVNATCYVCHMTFVREEISRVHFAKQITCIKCHGLSSAHANDEDVGATKPDITYGRDEVDKMCVKCHEHHDVPARDVIARFIQRKPTTTPAVCTDCHGHHRIEAALDEDGHKAHETSNQTEQCRP